MSKNQPPEARDRILRAGAQVMTAKSYNGCGLNEILAEARVPKGSFYYYFKSKEDLGVAVVEQATATQAATMRRYLLESEAPLQERLEAFFRMIRGVVVEHGAGFSCLLPKLALEAAELSDPIRDAVRSGFGRWSEVFTRAVEEGQESGEIHSGTDARRLADLLINAWQGVMTRVRVEGSTEPLDDFIGRFHSILRES